MNTAANGRFQQLDALRAVAITVVMLHHFINPPILVSGFGVTFLFVLSGYFATNSLLKVRRKMEERRTDLGGGFREFYLNRYLRICPMYFLVLLVTALFNVEGARDSLPWNTFFLANVQTVITGNWNGRFSPMWSLSFLEQFYTIWPVVILCCPRKWLMRVLLAGIAAGPLWRLVCAWQDLSAINWCVNPLASLDAVSCGALLALARSGAAGEQVLPRLLGVARYFALPGFLALMVLKAAHQPPWCTEIVIPLVASLSFVALAEKASRGFSGPVGWLFDVPILARIGQMSYSIFLIHTFTELLLPRWGVLGGILDSNYRAVVLIPCTVALAQVAWVFIEAPIAEVRRRAVRRDAAPAPAAVVLGAAAGS